MKKHSFIIKKAEMMLFFNALADLGYEKNLRIVAPALDNAALFRVHFQGTDVRMEDFLQKDDYGKASSGIAKKLKECKELPSHDHLCDALYQSGILLPSGLSRLGEVFSALSVQSVIHGGDVYYVAPDTNILRDRFFSAYLKDVLPRKNLDVILCETVRDELRNRKDKLGRAFFKRFQGSDAAVLESCFLNQNCLEDRLRYIGFLEYNRMRDRTSCEELAARHVKSGAQNDRFIIDAYSDFAAVGRKIIFLSRDNEAIRMMTGEDNVIPVLLERRPVWDETFTAPWDRFFEFFYLVGVCFGRLDVLVGGVRTASFYGVWRGKGVREWEEDLILLELPRPKGKDKEELEDWRFIKARMENNLRVLGALAGILPKGE